MTIRRIGPLSCAKIVGVIYACLGLLIGAIVSVFAMVASAFSGLPHNGAESSISPMIGSLVGAGAIIAFPIIYGGAAFIFALIAAWVYNLIASKVGGIEIDIG